MARLSHSFDSSAITDAAYDTDSRVLDLWYKGGDRYSYFDVPLPIYQALIQAPSAGEFVNREVKQFDYRIEQRRRRFRPD